ncbi:MAG: tRNA (guanosine(37)-N1)-methyltransferase TrmD [Clostridia bacterium]|nr:tRNA (guanosine(37)-N1)-methyltransferase TrmD [Clostridia bacterium]
MRLDILTLFPDMFTPLKESIIKRASDKNLVEINIIQIRDFSQDAHKKTDDIPYGGGAGMVMTPQPLYDAIQSVKTPNSYVIYLSPRGKVFNQPMARNLSKCEHLILVCGHYEGIDERIIELCIDEEISIGDYVLTGGELPAMVLADSIIRLLDGAISQDSLSEESFTNNLLEYPQYTRPQNFKGLEVPEVLLSGHHANIAKWRKEKSIEITRKNRPDLLDN